MHRQLNFAGAAALRMLGRLLAASGLAIALAACTHAPFLEANDHYSLFNARPPKGSTVYVCHAYGCRSQTKVKFAETEIKTLKTLMTKTKKADTPAEERRAVAYAIGWMERHVGPIAGTSSDRAGMDFSGSGDPSQ
ncbi:MAG TPA: hypothetical protein VMX97_18275, partial [Hyphomicrobiaceae bacterium]|nr:hypothetical protein [Hyphomicrobiaceae bacterium]